MAACAQCGQIMSFDEVMNHDCPADTPADYDLIAEGKKEVIKAACGIKTLSDRELLERLENLFLAGVEAGCRAMHAAR